MHMTLALLQREEGEEQRGGPGALQPRGFGHAPMRFLGEEGRVAVRHTLGAKTMSTGVYPEGKGRGFQATTLLLLTLNWSM